MSVTLSFLCIFVVVVVCHVITKSRWAVFIVVSRVLTVMRPDDVHYAKFLIPGIDMFNHVADRLVHTHIQI
jgi:general stress protein CsbA